MNDQKTKLTFRQYPFFDWFIGIIFLALAAPYLPNHSLSAGSFSFILMMLEVAIGLFLILAGSIMTISADRVA